MKNLVLDNNEKQSILNLLEAASLQIGISQAAQFQHLGGIAVKIANSMEKPKEIKQEKKGKKNAKSI